jgi:hypothetical protein
MEKMTSQTMTPINRRLAAQVGAGFSFALASFLLFATGDWLSLLLVPAGALLGLVTGIMLERHPALYHSAINARDTAVRAGSTLLRPFADERLPVRFILLFLLATVLFLTVWSLSYAFLPEGLLAGGSEVRMMGQDEAATTFGRELLFIAARNLPWVVGIALINLILGYPYACLIPLVWVVYYGLILGTNSFAIPMASPMAPSLAVLERAGPYELSAFLFAAAATYPLSRISLPWRPVAEEKQVSWKAIILGLLLSGAGVALAAWREAAMIFSS